MYKEYGLKEGFQFELLEKAYFMVGCEIKNIKYITSIWILGDLTFLWGGFSD